MGWIGDNIAPLCILDAHMLIVSKSATAPYKRLKGHLEAL